MKTTYYNALSHVEYVEDMFREGKIVKLNAIKHRDQYAYIRVALTGWYPVIMAAAAYYDAITSELPSEAEHARLMTVVRRQDGNEA